MRGRIPAASSRFVTLSIGIALLVAGCGAGGVPPQSPRPDPFAQAFSQELSSLSRGSTDIAALRILRRNSARWAQLISASIFQSPIDSATGGMPALAMLPSLPQHLAEPIAKRVLTTFYVSVPFFRFPVQYLIAAIRKGPLPLKSAALTQLIGIECQSPKVPVASCIAGLAAAPAADAPTVVGYMSDPIELLAITSPEVSDPVKAMLISRSFFAAEEFALLYRDAVATGSPEVVEAALIQGVQDQIPGAVTRLARLSDRYGAYSGIVWPASVMAAVKAADPHGLIARGMTAYSSISHAAYLDTHRCVPERPYCAFWLSTPAQYDPAALPQWQSWLRRFPNHPGSDDAAYVIGRIQEIDRHYVRAILSFWQSMRLPDGDMQATSMDRMVYVMDVEATHQDLTRLAAAPGISPELRDMARYVLAVHELRRGQLKSAIAGLQVAQKASLLMSGALPGEQLLPVLIPWQIAQARALLAATKGDQTGQRRLQRARLLFQNPLIYYLGLWQGGRAAYMGFGAGATLATPAGIRYQWLENNYAAAYRVFRSTAAMRRATPDQRAAALYGEAESLVELMNYGSGTDIIPYTVMQQRAISLLRQVGQRYAKSPVAPRAWMSLYYMTAQKKILPLVIRRYPGTPEAYDAKLRETPKYRFTLSSVQYAGGSPMDFQPLYTSNHLTAAERGFIAGATSGSTVIGNETLVRLRPTGLPAGTQPAITNILLLPDGTAEVQWTYYYPAKTPGLQRVWFPERSVARVFWRIRHVTFVKSVFYVGFP